MPTISFTNTFKIKSAQNSTTLSIQVTHEVDLLSKSEPSIALRRELPRILPIRFTSKISLALRGYLHNAELAHASQSRFGMMFLEALHLNRKSFTLDDISNAYVNNGMFEVAVTPSHMYLAEQLGSIFPPLSLRKICIEVFWTSEGSDPSDHPNILSSMMLDLWRMALDKVLLSLLKRYPYVFGAWKETLVANRELHPSMAESICQMFMRSPNLIFRQEGMRLYLLLREKIKNYKQSLWEKLEKLEGPTQQCILSLLDCKEADTGSNPAAGNLGVDEESFQKALCEALLLIHIQKVTPLRKQMMVQSLPEDVKISPVPALLECTHLDLLEHVDDFKLTPHYHEVSHAVIQEQPASSSVQEKYNFEDEMFNALPATSISKLPS